MLNTPYAILDSLLAEYTARHHPGRRVRPRQPGRHRRLRLQVVRGRQDQHLHQVRRLLGRRGLRRRAADPGLRRRQRQGQRAAGRPDPDPRQPALQPRRHDQGRRRRRADRRGRPVGAVHDARRPGAVRRRQGPPGDAADRRPPGDDRPDPERLRLAGQRPLRAARRRLRQRPAPARAGHRPGQVAARSRPARRGCRSSCSPATTSARWPSRPRTCSPSRPRRPGSRSRSPRRRRSTTTTTCPTRSPRTSGTPATTSRRPWSARSRPTRAAPTTRPTGTTQQHRDLVNAAAQEVDEAKRADLLHQAQEIEYNEGGLIIWGFRQQVDAYGANVQGLEPSKYLPLGNYKFNKVSV